MKKLALCFCIWKRHELERIIIEYYLGLCKQFNFDIVVCGSEGAKGAQIAKECVYIEYPNTPVSNKHNALIQSLKGKDYDGAILIGSDDLIEKKLFAYYHKMANIGTGYYGFQDVYYWQPKQNRLAHWNGRFMGAGRFFTRQVLEKMDYTLWREGLMSGLDTSNRTLLELNGINIKQSKLTDLDAMIVDVKGFGSISSEGIVQAGINQHGEQDLNMLYERFDNTTLDKIKSLSASASLTL